MAEPRLSACVVVFVRGAEPRMLWVRRSEGSPFLAGFHVFPGGQVDAADAQAPHRGGELPEVRVAALRELFEEAGVLLADGSEALTDAARAALRAARGEDAARLTETLGLRWQTDRLVPIGRWVAPEYAPHRFDTRFFAVVLDAPPAFEADGREVDSAELVTGAEASRRWARGQVLLGPPAASIVRSFSTHGLDFDRMRAARGADGGETHRFEVVPGVQMMPLRTPTLPPATHTNAYLVGTRECVLIEPASPYEEDLARAVQWVDEARSEGLEPIAILATHHHPDHVGGAAALSKRLSLPLWAHVLTAERLRGQLQFARTIADGERIELDGPTRHSLRAVHTPGHAPGHLCFVDEASGAMVAGDMVASVGTILVESVDGDMSLYLDSLARMMTLRPSLLLPAHGGPIRDASAKLAQYIAHRLLREAKVLGAVAKSPGSLSSALVPLAYDDAPPAVWPIAALALEAHLARLGRTGRVSRDASARWWSA